MPIYQFRCDNPECGREEELILAVSARDGDFNCERCAKGKLIRQLSTGIKGYVH